MSASVRELADLATPMAVRTAATLGLVDHAGPDGAGVEQLADASGTSASALRRLLDHLVTVGVFTFDTESERYRATPLGAQMRQDAPEGVRPLLDMNQAGGRAELAFVELPFAIRSNQAAYPRRFGRDFWSDLDADPRLRRSFDAQMRWRFQTQAPQIARRHDWSRHRRILDVGGGEGTVLAAILAAHPSVSGQVLDLAPTATAADARFAEVGLGERAGAMAGSFFDPLPMGFDAYLLCDILHDWDDEHARLILTRCRKAAGTTGIVLVIESAGEADVSTGIDLFMLMCFGGGERPVETLTALAADAGLHLRTHHPVSQGRTLLEFVPA